MNDCNVYLASVLNNNYNNSNVANWLYTHIIENHKADGASHLSAYNYQTSSKPFPQTLSKEVYDGY